MAKIAVLLGWLWGAASLFGPMLGLAVPGARYGVWLFWFLVIAHAVECVVFLPKLRRAGGSLAAQLVQTLVFGIVHVRTLFGDPPAIRPRQDG